MAKWSRRQETFSSETSFSKRERERERERERVRERERKTKKYLIVCENGCVLPSVCKRKSGSSVTKWKDYYSIFGHLQ